MIYNVIDRFRLDDDTVVAIDGNGDGLKNNMLINDGRFTLLSTGMLNNVQNEKITKRIMLIKGDFTENTVYV